MDRYLLYFYPREKESFAVINAARYQFNVSVMEAALAVGAHCVDLGGLFHVTKIQLKMDDAFKRKGLTALLGRNPCTTFILK